MLQRPNGRLRTICYPDLSQDRFHVGLDRRLGDVARARNHLIGKPFHQAVEDLGLTL